MEDITISWPISRHATFTSFRTSLLLIIFFAAISIYSFAFPEGRAHYVRLSFFLLIYACLTLSILKSYQKERNQFITVKGDLMKIPRLGRKPTKLNLSLINSIKKYHLSGDLISILVGQPTRSPIMIELRSFDSKNDFHRCVQLLNDFSLRNQNQKTAEQLALISMPRNKAEAWAVNVLAAIQVLLYFLFSEHGIEKINDEVINRAGLIKQIFILDEYYRIFTSFSLHYSPFHLLPNVISLSIVGHYIIRIFGIARFINILLLSSICGALLSLAFSPYQIVIGASGGIFGLIGAHLCACTKFYEQLPADLSISIKRIFFILVLQIFLDLIVEGGDIFSHLGGSVLGYIYALCAFGRRPIIEAANATRVEIFLSLTLAISYFLSFAYFFRQ